MAPSSTSRAATWAALLSTALIAGCVDDARPTGDETVTLEADAKADAELRVRLDGLTVWSDAAIVHADGPRPWRLELRASRNLTGVFSFIPDDGFAEARLLSARTFEVALDDAELTTISSGLPLFVQLTPSTGAAATVAVWLAPRLGDFTGASVAYLDSTVKSRWVAGTPTFRGGARTNAGWFLSARGATAAQVVRDPVTPTRWQLDWGGTLFARGWAEPFTFELNSMTGFTSKSARPRYVVQRLGLTRGDAYEVWPRICTTSVRTCLAALPAGTVDAGECGTFEAVAACGGLAIAAIPDGPRLTGDLRARLVGYYTDHPDTIANGGNPLAAAQAAVTDAGFRQVTAIDEDPVGHDLGTYWVFAHPDPIFPGSDTVWFLVYDKASGALVEAYEFN